MIRALVEVLPSCNLDDKEASANDNPNRIIPNLDSYKNDPRAVIQNIADDSLVLEMKKEYAGDYTQSTTTITLLKDTGREEYYCGTLVKTADIRKTTRDKKRASADQNTDSAESHSDSEPQEHSNQEQQKNQESYTDNMINAEDLLTPEENALFGQMSFSDYPGVVPEGNNNGKTSNAKPGNDDGCRV